MTHLTMEQLLALREPGLEPGMADVREHLAGCAVCAAEVRALDQRVARLRALPGPRPAGDGFPAVRAAWVAERRARRTRSAVWTGLAMAASLALGFAVQPILFRDQAPAPVMAAGDQELEQVMARSRELESALNAWDPDSRVLDGRTAGMAFRIEEQLGALDRRLEMLNMLSLEGGSLRTEQLKLWRERVGLLDALMDVHLTRASLAGL